jgi:acetyl esterase/lipase
MAGLLSPKDYPKQETPPPAAVAYREEALRQGAGIEGRDCAYGDNVYQRVALFVPPRPNGTVLAYMHGGGWTSGFKEMLAFMAPAFCDAGIIFASMGYRLAPDHLFPDQFDDTGRGLAWLHGHVGEYGGNPARIFVGGHSAGGHYAALLSVRRDWQARHGLPADVIKGCLPVSGVFDLTSSGGLSARPRFLGPVESGHDAPASPIKHDLRHAPPFLMAHGDKDFPHLMRQAADMERALLAAGVAAERIVFAGCDHFQSSLATADASKPWRRRSVEWMMAHARIGAAAV